MRMRPALSEDFRWIIGFVLLSMMWLGLIYLLAPTYLDETMMTAHLMLVAGGLYGCCDVPNLWHHGYHQSVL
jgi:hypothetical protein